MTAGTHSTRPTPAFNSPSAVPALASTGCTLCTCVLMNTRSRRGLSGRILQPAPRITLRCGVSVCMLEARTTSLARDACNADLQANAAAGPGKLSLAHTMQRYSARAVKGYTFF